MKFAGCAQSKKDIVCRMDTNAPKQNRVNGEMSARKPQDSQKNMSAKNAETNLRKTIGGFRPNIAAISAVAISNLDRREKTELMF